MTTTLTSDQAQRIIEILSDVHDEQQPDNPEYAAEIDALCAALQPQVGLFTVVFQSEDSGIHVNTVRAADERMALHLTAAAPGLPSFEGSPITIVKHGDEAAMPPVGLEAPLLVGEYVYFQDPADGVSSGLYRITEAPELAQLLHCNPELGAEAYADTVVQLVNDAGSELEAYARELRRIA